MQSKPHAIVEVTRGAHIESIHAASLVICDGDGNAVLEMGEGEREIFPRSAIKSLQALALVESGAAEHYGFEPSELALACSSHNGEPIHVKAAIAMLQKAGLTCNDLECGCHNPMYAPAAEILFRSGEQIGPEHNNCSGKHAGFLAFAAQGGLKTNGYVDANHPVQQEIAAILENLTGMPHDESVRAIDGCSIPTYAIPLKNIAAGAGRFACQANFSPRRTQAARQILSACCDFPEMVAGTERVCTRIMKIVGRRASVKVGAEGVYVAMYPQLGLGAALKVHDGQARAAECLIAEISRHLLKLNGQDDALLGQIANPILKNHNKFQTGMITLSDDTRRILSSSIG